MLLQKIIASTVKSPDTMEIGCLAFVERCFILRDMLKEILTQFPGFVKSPQLFNLFR